MAIGEEPKTTAEEKQEAYKAIAKLPRHSSKTRLRNRCKVTAGHGASCVTLRSAASL